MAGKGPHQKLIKYKVKADQAQENIDHIQSVFRGLEKSGPDQLRYLSLQLEDVLSFVHVAFVEAAEGAGALHQLEEFKAWANEISSRCEEPPTFSLVSTMGSYRVLNYAISVPESGHPEIENSVGQPTRNRRRTRTA